MLKTSDVAIKQLEMQKETLKKVDKIFDELRDMGVTLETPIISGDGYVIPVSVDRYVCRYYWNRRLCREVGDSGT
jgi:hypothetical protein